MNGAQALLRTLGAAGVDTVLANPGTSEMHLVAALDLVPDVRAVLALDEGVVTGAADGYGRMAGRPAATLLHLGPGLGNGLANLHNARRAGTPLVNLVGDHATHHKALDAPLESDIDAVAGSVSSWVRRSMRSADVGADAATAVAAASGPPGSIATLIVPADAAWDDGAAPGDPVAVAPPAAVPADRVAAVAAALRSGERAAVLVGGPALREAPLRAAAAVAATTGARFLVETFPARLERGAGLPEPEPLGYFAEMAAAQLDGVRHLVLAGARSPVAFFAYPGKPGDLVPDGCDVHVLCGPGEDAAAALGALAGEVAPGVAPALAAAARPERPRGPLDVAGVAAAVGALLPEGAVVVDEAITSGLHVRSATAGAPRHDWLTLTGGAIGLGLPMAVGAALAVPDRRVVALQADGSAMYTIQALWTMARESLDVTVVLFNNGSYAILNVELGRVGAEPGPRSRDLLDLRRPDLDFCALAQGMGVPAQRVRTGEELTRALEASLDEPGPRLIEAMVQRAM